MTDRAELQTDRDFVCGTRRAVKRGPSDYRVVCATCRGGGSFRYPSHNDAVHAAIRDSAKPCRCRWCGAT